MVSPILRVLRFMQVYTPARNTDPIKDIMNRKSLNASSVSSPRFINRFEDFFLSFSVLDYTIE